MGKLLNFDQFMAEKKAETIDVQVFGKIYKVKKEIPAFIVVEAARAGESKDASVMGLVTLKMGDIMFGKDAITEMCEKGMSAEALSVLITRTFAAIRGTDVDGEDVEAEYSDESGYVRKPGTEPKK